MFSNSSDVNRAVEGAVGKYQRIDILVNNAAFAIKGTVATITEEEWDRQIDVNLKSVYSSRTGSSPSWPKTGRGDLERRVSDQPGRRPSFAAYVATKSGMLGIHSSHGAGSCPTKIRQLYLSRDQDTLME
jgi:NAD(P)-dependent dehydrogenase (short-subunit alcohol dehydrogenase family)